MRKLLYLLALSLVAALAVSSYPVFAQEVPMRMYLRVSQMDTITVTIPDTDIKVKLNGRKTEFVKDGMRGTVTLDNRIQGMSLNDSEKDNDLIGILSVVTGDSLPTRYLVLFHALGYRFEQCDYFLIGKGFEVKDFWTGKWSAGSMKYFELRGTDKYKVIVELLTWLEGQSLSEPPTSKLEFSLTVSKHRFMEKQ